MMKRTYSELVRLPTFTERLRYLLLDGTVAAPTFGANRYLNQKLYRSPDWQRVRRLVIIRDGGNDLGVEGYSIEGAILIHHINPIEAALAALLHDSAKCLPFEIMLSYAHEAGITDPTFLSSSAMLHGPVGAYIAREQFSVSNQDVLNAITCT